ncbi:MAG: ATP-binding protein [Oscillatoriales cyanobacterium]|nr:MAG: ATP-binding protein [Oscillatoriales cyanobacterium]
MTSASPLHEIHQAIQEYNPFNLRSVVKHQDVWNTDFVDVEFLHAQASDLILGKLQETQAEQDPEKKTSAFVITAEQGVGKSHLIRRLHRRIYEGQNGFFLYMSFSLCGDINLIHYELRQAIARSLSQSTILGISQWQLLAASVIEKALLDPKSQQVFDPADFVKRFDKLYRSHLAQGRDLVTILVGKCQGLFPEVDPDVLRALLWTLSEPHAPYAIKWLGGDELSSARVEEMKLPNITAPEISKEQESFKISLALLKLLSAHRSTLLCFDETEIPQVSEQGFSSTQILAYLIKQIFDSLHQSTNSGGLVLSSFMFANQWSSEVVPLAGASDRMTAGTGDPINLKQLDGQSFPKLVRFLLAKKFYKPRGLTPPHPLYPFNEEEIKTVSKERPPVRKALRWCAENFVVTAPPVPPEERFQKGFEEKLQDDYQEAIADSATLAETLRYCFELVVGQTISGETKSGEKIEAATITAIAEVEPKSKNAGYINFKIVGTEQDKPFVIGVAVLQQSGLSFAAGLNRLTDYNTFSLTRGCLIRGVEFKIKTFWDSYKTYQKFIQRQGGEHIEPDPESLKTLMALKAVFESASIYGLTEAEVQEFSRSIALNNEILLEILSDPSGLIDPSIIDDETLVSMIIGDDNHADTYEEGSEDDLIDLLIGSGDEDSELDDASQPAASPGDASILQSLTLKSTYKGKKLCSFSLRGETHSVKTWREMYIKLNQIFAEYHLDKFREGLPVISGRKSHFSQDPTDIHTPFFLEKAGLYLETKLSVASILNCTEKLLNHFGYLEDELTLQVVDRSGK